jgi:hypothetical protein
MKCITHLSLTLALAFAHQVVADDATSRELHRQLQQRQQQQDQLQLRMQQYQRDAQPPRASVPQEPAIRQLEIEQQQRQRELHYRQQQSVPPPSPMDDEATRRAKAQLDQQRADQESRRQLQRFDRELEQARRRQSGD